MIEGHYVKRCLRLRCLSVVYQPNWFFLKLLLFSSSAVMRVRIRPKVNAATDVQTKNAVHHLQTTSGATSSRDV